MAATPCGEAVADDGAVPTFVASSELDVLGVFEPAVVPALDPGAVVEEDEPGGALSFEAGSRMLSIDTAVPAWQLTGPPSSVCHVLPVTWMSSAG